MIVRQETEADHRAVGAVHDGAFGGTGEALLVEASRVEAQREGGFFRAGMSLVAEMDAGVVGHILFSDLPVRTGRGEVLCAALAPLGVLPGFQGRGVGSRLVGEGLARLAALGFAAALVLGDPGYYGRFGFEARLAARIASPFSGENLLGLDLEGEILAALTRGEAAYPEPFFRSA